jgi:heat shock protein HslJ
MITNTSLGSRYISKQLNNNSANQMTYLIKRIKKYWFTRENIDNLPTNKILFVFLVLFILATTSGCKSATNEAPEIDNTPSELIALQSARTKWASQARQYYTIQSQRFCECLPEVSSQMKVSVLGNSVLSAVDINSAEVISKEVQQEIPTVEHLFSLIEQAIADDTSIEVTYNEDYGYPENTKINLEQLAVDGGLHVTLSKLDFQDPLLSLDDVTWTLESFGSIAGPQPLIKNTSVTLSIDLENRKLSGTGSCNHYGADFILDNDNHNITISPIFSTEMWCGEPEDIMQQEQNYFATLAQIRFITFDNATLNMVVGGDAGLHFVARQSPVDEPETDSPSKDLAALLDARKKWDRLSGQYYTIQSQRMCFCLPEMSALMKISVLDNSVLSAFDVNSGEAISKDIQQEVATVELLFNLIDKAIADGISTEITYNDAYGYPEITKIDVEQLAVDGGLHIILSTLALEDSRLALDDVTWTLTSFDNIAGPQPIIKNTQLTLSIDLEINQLTGSGGCNNYSADFVLDNKDHNITISNIISTEMACTEPENLMQQEQNYFAVLADIRFFSFNNATLNMGVGADAGFHFVAAEQH